jgi:hypothetical protein
MLQSASATKWDTLAQALVILDGEFGAEEAFVIVRYTTTGEYIDINRGLLMNRAAIMVLVIILTLTDPQHSNNSTMSCDRQKAVAAR